MVIYMVMRYYMHVCMRWWYMYSLVIIKAGWFFYHRALVSQVKKFLSTVRLWHELSKCPLTKCFDDQEEFLLVSLMKSGGKTFPRDVGA